MLQKQATNTLFMLVLPTTLSSLCGYNIEKVFHAIATAIQEETIALIAEIRNPP